MKPEDEAILNKATDPRYCRGPAFKREMRAMLHGRQML
jgi:hypothetical protein